MTEPTPVNCRCTMLPVGAVDSFLEGVRTLSDEHLRAAIDGQLDALRSVLKGKRAWGTREEITAGLEVMAAELRRRHATSR